MVNIQKQVEYWKNGADEDIKAAEALLDKASYRHALFFLHLTIEKILKAHVSKVTVDIPPRIHNLLRLAEIAGLELPDEYSKFIRYLNRHQMDGRYPDQTSAVIDKDRAKRDMEKTREIFEWLKMKL